MNSSEASSTSPTAEPDALEAVASVAREIGAHSLCHHLRDVAQRLEQWRLFVETRAPSADLRADLVNALLGEAVLPLDRTTGVPVVIRFGVTPRARVCFQHDVVRSVDLESARDFLSSHTNPNNQLGVSAVEIRCESHLLRNGICLVEGSPPAAFASRIDIVVDAPHDIAKTVSMLAALAAETGAAQIESVRLQEARRACVRLEQHLLEERRALARIPEENQRYLDAIAASTIVFEALIAGTRDRMPVVIASLRAELAAEQRKLIMGQKADLLADLDDRVLHCVARKRDLRSAAVAYADEIASDALRRWGAELRTRADRRLSTYADEIVSHARGGCGDDFERIISPAFMGISLIPDIRAARLEHSPPPAPGRLTTIADLLAPDRSVRAVSAAVAAKHLVSLLECESNGLVEWHLRYFDEACAQLQAMFVDALDDFARAATVASSRARDANAAGRHAVRQAHERIDAWLRTLDELHRRFE